MMITLPFANVSYCVSHVRDKEAHVILGKYGRGTTLTLSPFSVLRLPATPADVALLMQLGVDGVFVGSGIFKSANPAKRAKAMVQAVTHFNDPKILAEVSEDLGEPMVGHVIYVNYGSGTSHSIIWEPNM